MKICVRNEMYLRIAVTTIEVIFHRKVCQTAERYVLQDAVQVLSVHQRQVNQRKSMRKSDLKKLVKRVVVLKHQGAQLALMRTVDLVGIKKIQVLAEMVAKIG